MTKSIPVNKMFLSNSFNMADTLNPSLFRSLAGCASTCPENSCLIDCECKTGDDCPMDINIILIVGAAVVVVIILVFVGCYLYRKEKKDNRRADLQVAQISRVSRRELDSLDNSTAKFREDPLYLSALNNAPTDPYANAQVVIRINSPERDLSPVEDRSTMVIANNQPVDQTEAEIVDYENDKPIDTTGVQDVTQLNKDHSSLNILIHKTTLNQQDTFEVSGDQDEESLTESQYKEIPAEEQNEKNQPEKQDEEISIKEQNEENPAEKQSVQNQAENQDEENLVEKLDKEEPVEEQGDEKPEEKQNEENRAEEPDEEKPIEEQYDGNLVEELAIEELSKLD